MATMLINDVVLTFGYFLLWMLFRILMTVSN